MNDSPVSAAQNAAKAEAPVPELGSSRLLPDFVYSPIQVLFWAILPQALLLWVNWQSYSTIAGDLATGDHVPWFGALGGGGVLIAGYLCFMVKFLAGRRQLSPRSAVFALLPMPMFLGYTLVNLASTVPSGASLWILRPDTVVLHQLTGVVPTFLFFGVVLVGHKARDMAVEVFLCLTTPCLVLFANGHMYRDLEGAFILVVMMMLGMLCTFGILRLLITGYRGAARASSRGLCIMGVCLGLVLPLIGLMVNESIPFPYDFQTGWIVLLTVVNGVLVSLPSIENELGRRLIWLGQCALLPFTLYFFFVFLPFFPLAVPGMIFWGGGLLVIVPTALALFQAFRVYDGFQLECRSSGRLVPAVLGVFAFCMIPGSLAWRAGQDRAALHEALDFAYSESPTANARFDGDLNDLKRTLTNLVEFKTGKQLPLVSGFYNRAVFDGLVLPDSKIKDLSLTFLNEEINAVSRGGMLRGNMFGMRTRMGNPPHTNVALLPPRAKQTIEGEFVRTVAMVDMRNGESSQGEFKTTLTLPKNAAVSGFWLHIGHERVPGRMTEKKSALWVYQMIRDVTRRDPGILRYVSPDQLELRVFPFAGLETRTVEIEFLAPANISADVTIGDQTIALQSPSSQPDAGLWATDSETGASFGITKQKAEQLPSIRRVPYLHFIVDRSANSTATPGNLVRAIEAAAEKIPDARRGQVTLANFEAATLTTEPIEFSELVSLIRKDWDEIPTRGGFRPGRVAHYATADYIARFQTAQPGDWAFQSYPVMMVVSGSGSEVALEGESLGWMNDLIPDTNQYFCSQGLMRSIAWQPRAYGSRAYDSNRAHRDYRIPVALVRMGRSNAAISSGEGGVGHLFAAKADDPTVFEEKTRSFVPIEGAVVAERDLPYAQALNLWRDQLSLTVDPAGQGEVLRNLVLQSRESGILTNGTAYIAVESHAQWKMLEEAEKKKLRANQAMELGEMPANASVPEPSTALLLMMAMTVLGLRRRRR
jgi:hypothetical protein